MIFRYFSMIFTAVSAVFFAFNADAEETIARWGNLVIPVFTPNAAAQFPFSGNVALGASSPTQQNSFTVYTVPEVNSKLHAVTAELRDVDTRYAAAMSGLAAQVMRAVNEAVIRMEGQLLTPAAQERISREIAARLAGEVESRIAVTLRGELARLEARLSALEAGANHR